MMRWFLLAVFICAAPVMAVEPDEVLDDPALEARARVISVELRCLVCRNESIDESNAELARDLRILVRERLVAGDTNDEVLSFLTARYGEYVLLKPTTKGVNLLLWVAGPLMLLSALFIAFLYIRGGKKDAPAIDALSDEEQARLDEILRK